MRQNERKAKKATYACLLCAKQPNLYPPKKSQVRSTHAASTAPPCHAAPRARSHLQHLPLRRDLVPEHHDPAIQPRRQIDLAPRQAQRRVEPSPRLRERARPPLARLLRHHAREQHPFYTSLVPVRIRIRIPVRIPVRVRTCTRTPPVLPPLRPHPLPRRPLPRLRLPERKHRELELREPADPRAHRDARLQRVRREQQCARGREVARRAVRDAEQEQAERVLVGRVERWGRCGGVGGVGGRLERGRGVRRADIDRGREREPLADMRLGDVLPDARVRVPDWQAGATRFSTGSHRQGRTESTHRRRALRVRKSQ